MVTFYTICATALLALVVCKKEALGTIASVLATPSLPPASIPTERCSVSAEEAFTTPNAGRHCSPFTLCLINST